MNVNLPVNLSRIKGSSKKVKAIGFVAGFAVVSTILLLVSRAGTPFVSTEPESALSSNIVPPAVIGNDASASGGQYIQFDTAAGGGDLPAIRGFIENSDGAHNALFKTLGFTAAIAPASMSGLDAAQAQGLKAIVWLGDYNKTGCTWPSSVSNSAITTKVNAIKNHPALIGYWIADEPEQSRCASIEEDLTARSQLIRSLDPNQAHFTYTIVSNRGYNTDGSYASCYDYARFMGTTDVMGLDIYPYRPSADIDCVANGRPVTDDISNAIAAWNTQSAAYRTANPTFVPRFYAILQDFQDSNWRRPTVQELRDQFAAWRGSGMEGLYYFSWDWQGNSLDGFTDHHCEFKIQNGVVPSC